MPECASEIECVLAIIVSTGANALRLIFGRDRLVGEYRFLSLAHLFCGLLLPEAIAGCIRDLPLCFHWWLMCADLTSAVAAGADLYDLRVVYVSGMALATGVVFGVDPGYRQLALCRSRGDASDRGIGATAYGIRLNRWAGEVRFFTLANLFCDLLLPAAIVDCIREYPMQGALWCRSAPLKLNACWRSSFQPGLTPCG